LTASGRRLQLRKSEWIILAYYVYVAALSPFFAAHSDNRFQPEIVLVLAAVLITFLVRAQRTRWTTTVTTIRDWLPILLTLVAFREMEMFLPRFFDLHLESVWVKQDRLVLNTWHLHSAIESLGPVLPFYFELCYFLVYGVSAFCIAALYLTGHRRSVDDFYFTYLLGTLGAYALFPYFPSRPPRLVYPLLDPPTVTTWVRNLNLFILQHATIHVAVFPSAHVSSAFSAAWSMFILLPRRKMFGSVALAYAISVSIATVYGRYHYVADVVAGFGISLVAGALTFLLRRKLLICNQCIEK